MVQALTFSLRSTFSRLILTLFLILFNILSIFPQSNNNMNGVYLVIRGDDMGFCHSTNLACIQSYREGVIRSVEVMAPGPWFLEAVNLLKENPGLDAGVHLTLTSEWKNYKWRPLTGAKELTDSDGYFFADLPDLKKADPGPDIVEKELRAQIELALKYIPGLSHLSDHMGASSCRPEYVQVVNKLSQEYNLPLMPEGAHEEIGFWNIPPAEKENFLASTINSLEPGLWIIYCHPGLDTPETQGIEATGNNPSDIFMAEYRAAVTRALTSERLKDLIHKKDIHLVSYRDVIK
jgi:hypothetical protein